MEKKKKEYVKPQMTVIKIDGKCTILAGSDGDGINKGTEFNNNWDEVD